MKSEARTVTAITSGMECEEEWSLAEGVVSEVLKTPGESPKTQAEPGIWVRTATRRQRVLWDAGDMLRAQEMSGRALVNLGVQAGDVVAIAVGNPALSTALAQGALAIQAQALPDADDSSIADARATVLVTDPATAMNCPRLSSLHTIILTGAPGFGEALTAFLARRLGEHVAAQNLYAVTEEPGPLAISCKKGRLHFTSDGVQVELWRPDGGGPAGVGETAEVIVTDERERASSLDHWHTGDLVRVSFCDCGSEGPVADWVLGQNPAPYVNGRPLFVPDILDALCRTPGFGGRATATVLYDRGRGSDYVSVAMTVEPGYEEDRVEAAAFYSLDARLKVPVRVEGLAADGTAGVTLTDARR